MGENLRMNKPADSKPKKHAVALHYQNSDNIAPKVVAKGSGYVAEKILATAKHHAVPVYQNKTLVSMLMAVELDREIPPELYQAVAEVLAHIYRIDQIMGSKII
jgi:flagellar biosynthesis protein